MVWPPNYLLLLAQHTPASKTFFMSLKHINFTFSDIFCSFFHGLSYNGLLLIQFSAQMSPLQIHQVCPKSYHSEHIINHIYSMYYKQKLSHVCICSNVFVYSLIESSIREKGHGM